MKNLKHVQRNQSLVFKHWAKKKYSAFKTIGKVVTIATLNVAYFGSLGELSAQENTEDLTSISKNIDLEEVEVVAETSPQLASEAARVVEVISRKEIEASSAQSVNEILEFAVGVDVRQRGQHGVQADLSIRGGTFDQVMVLLNGVNITDPQTGHYNLNLPVDLESIERIEILEGPGARYWGPNAFTGAINIVTKQVTKNEGSASVSIGENQYLNASGDVSIKHGAFQHYIYAGGRASDGYIANSDYNMYTGYYNGTYRSDLGTASIQAGYTEKEYGANTFYTPKYPYQFAANRTLFASAKFETQGEHLRLTPQVYFRRNHDRFELYREKGYFEKTDDGFRVMGADTVPTWYGGHNYHMTTTMGGELNGKYYSEFGITSFGGTVRSEQIYSNTLGYNMPDTKEAPGEKDGVFSKTSFRANYSLFAEHFYEVGNLAGSIGIMGNYNTSDENIRLYPGVDIAYRLNKKWKTYASASKSFRMPTFTDLYYNGPQNVGNPDLEAEQAWTYEAGIKYRYNGIRAHAAVYLRDGQNLIDWVKVDPADTKMTTVNHNAALTTGLDLSMLWKPSVTYKTRTLVKSLQLSYGYINTDIDLQGLESAYVGDYLQNKFTAQLSHYVYNKLSAHWAFRYQDRAGQYEKFENGANLGYVDYDPFGLLDLKLTWDDASYTIYIEASNLLNKEYVDFGNIPQPGRWVIGGIKIKF